MNDMVRMIYLHLLTKHMPWKTSTIPERVAYDIRICHIMEEPPQTPNYIKKYVSDKAYDQPFVDILVDFWTNND